MYVFSLTIICISESTSIYSLGINSSISLTVMYI